MEKRKLSDFNLDHIIYMSVGEHCNEPLADIMSRKEEEIGNESGMSLWAFQKTLVSKLIPLCNQWQDKNGNICTLFIESGTPTSTSPRTMNYYIIDGKKERIPEEITVTATSSPAYALVVEKYYEISEDDNIINTGEYDFSCRFNYIAFRNKIDVEKPRKNLHKVKYIAKLKAPFIVEVME